MRTRTVLATALVGLLAAGSATPSFAAKAKPKPKPIVGTYKASAVPDPTSTSQVDNIPCKPTLPTGMHSHPFTVPAAGTLEIVTANQLDWSLALRDAGGTLATSDGGGPQDIETVLVSFKKKTAVSIDACNFAGEPEIAIKYTFTYK